MLAEIIKVLPSGTCAICDREAECFETEFDKLKGDFCLPCVKRLLKAKSTRKESKKEASPTGHEVSSTK